jgi:arylsulfatase A-like enzyme
MRSVALALAAAGVAGAAALAPNVLFIMADQFRADALGGPCGRTPNLDALAAQGATFQQHRTSLPTCTPARSCA